MDNEWNRRNALQMPVILMVSFIVLSLRIVFLKEIRQ